MEMENVYIVGAVRAAVGEYDSSLKSVSAHTTGALVIQGAIRHADVSEEWIDEVILDEAWQSIEASNIARYAALEAGLPENVSGFTVNRLCASAMQVLFSSCQEVRCGEADVIVAGGTEDMSRVPHYLRHEHWRDDPLTLVDSNIEAGTTTQPASIHGTTLSMPKTMGNVAGHFHITREEQDRFTAESQHQATAVTAAGYFREEILPVKMKEKKKSFVFDTDKFPRPSTTMEVPAALRPIVKPDGTVTAGNSCGLNDGASALVLISERKIEESELRPLARIVGITRAALDPAIMGYDPVYATRRIMEHTGMTVGQMDLVELNEVFASQTVACMQDPDLDSERVNINGKAIALGHPLGSTSARPIVTLLHNLMRIDDRYGLATLYIGGGQLMATMTEKL